MTDDRYCMDCGVPRPMDVHGRCAKCGSGAMALADPPRSPLLRQAQGLQVVLRNRVVLHLLKQSNSRR